MVDETKQAEAPDLRCCRHMEQWCSALADGSLTGIALWYTRLHVAGCKQCQAALAALEQLKLSLKALRTTENSPVPVALTPERRLSLQAALDAVEGVESTW